MFNCCLIFCWVCVSLFLSFFFCIIVVPFLSFDKWYSICLILFYFIFFIFVWFVFPFAFHHSLISAFYLHIHYKGKLEVKVWSSHLWFSSYGGLQIGKWKMLIFLTDPNRPKYICADICSDLVQILSYHSPKNSMSKPKILVSKPILRTLGQGYREKKKRKRKDLKWY